MSLQTITWQQFEQVDLRVGTVTKAAPFPEANKSAFKLWVDFGEKVGTLASSAQITDRYSIEDLTGKQVIGVVNFPPKQIGPFISECLITGFFQHDNEVVLAVPDKQVPNGSKLC